MNHQKLINQISSELKPVKPLWSVGLRTFIFPTLYLLTTAIILGTLHPLREGLSDDFKRPTFLLECLLFLISIYSFSYYSFSSVVPGAYKRSLKNYIYFPVILLTSLLLFKIFLPPTPSAHANMGFFCEIEIMIAGALLIPHFYYLIQKGFFVEKRVTLFLISFTAALIPSSLMHLICSSEAKHVFTFHLMPTFIFALSCSYLIRHFSNKESK